MERFLISNYYGYGDFTKYYDNSESEWRYRIFTKVPLFAHCDWYKKLPPIFIIEEGDCFREIISKRKIRCITFETGADPKKYIVVEENVDYIINEFCFLFPEPTYYATKFEEEFKKCKYKFIKRLNIEKYFNDAPIFAKELKIRIQEQKAAELVEENKAKARLKKLLGPVVENKTSTKTNLSTSVIDNNILKKGRISSSAILQSKNEKDLLEKIKKELMTTNTNPSENSNTQKNVELTPLQEYIAKQKQKTK